MVAKSIIVVSGAKGSGKSSALATYPPATAEEMSKLLYVDTEDSANDLYQGFSNLGMPFTLMRAYERFASEDVLRQIAKGDLPWVSSDQRNSLASYYEWFVEQLDKVMVKGKYKYLAIDTVEPIEAGMAAWSENNKRKSGWSGTRAYGRLETEAVRPLYENFFEAVARRGVEYILLASHLKRVWENDRPVLNKVQIGGRLVVLSRLARLMLFLTPASPRNPNGEPAALILKSRYGVYKPIETPRGIRMQIRRVLPERIPKFTWDVFDGYFDSPANFTNPAPGETMTTEDKELISEFLTDEQMRLMVAAAEQDLISMKLEEARATGSAISTDDDDDIIKEIMSFLSANGEANNGDVMNSVRGATLPKIIKARKKLAEDSDGGY